jgi:hypothetical protein
MTGSTTMSNGRQCPNVGWIRQAVFARLAAADSTVGVVCSVPLSGAVLTSGRINTAKLISIIDDPPERCSIEIRLRPLRRSFPSSRMARRACSRAAAVGRVKLRAYSGQNDH